MSILIFQIAALLVTVQSVIMRLDSDSLFVFFLFNYRSFHLVLNKQKDGPRQVLSVEMRKEVEKDKRVCLQVQAVEIPSWSLNTRNKQTKTN